MQKGFGTYKTDGIILKSASLGEADLLLTLYTRGYGKILVRAISARKKESKLKGYLQTFTRGRFLLAKSKTLDIVTDVEEAEQFCFLRNNLAALALAYYFAELVDKLVVAPERDENVWRLLVRAFEVLNALRPNLQIKDAFEKKLLEFLGYGQVKNKSAPDFIQELTGEIIKSESFLRALKVG